MESSIPSDNGGEDDEDGDGDDDNGDEDEGDGDDDERRMLMRNILCTIILMVQEAVRNRG